MLNEIDVRKMSEPEQVLLMEQLRDQQVARVEKGLQEATKKILETKRDVVKIQNDLKKVNDQVSKVTRMTNVIGFGPNSCKGRIFRNATKARCYQILGNNSSIECQLFYSYFCQKISRDITGRLGVSTIGNISVDDFERAMDMAHKWKPSDEYVQRKVQELLERRENGILSPEKCTALKTFLNLYPLGVNPFRNR